MFKGKNLSPKQLAALTALLLATLITLSVFILFSNWQLLLVYFIVSFAIIYFILYEILERFIYRKIKLIYKLFHKPKQVKEKKLTKSTFYHKKELMK